MTIDELLTELETWPKQNVQSEDAALAAASKLMRAAALTIRQLRIAEIKADIEDHWNMT